MKARIIIFLSALCLLTASAAFAESAPDIRRRMEQRLPQIDALKEQEAVGENNAGYLEERKAGVSGAATVVAEENRDRGAVYALIAKQTNANPEAVGRARAKKLAANSRPGVWVQDESGRWTKK